MNKTSIAGISLATIGFALGLFGLILYSLPVQCRWVSPTDYYCAGPNLIIGDYLVLTDGPRYGIPLMIAGGFTILLGIALTVLGKRTLQIG